MHKKMLKKIASYSSLVAGVGAIGGIGALVSQKSLVEVKSDASDVELLIYAGDGAIFTQNPLERSYDQYREQFAEFVKAYLDSGKNLPQAQYAPYFSSFTGVEFRQLSNAVEVRNVEGAEDKTGMHVTITLGKGDFEDDFDFYLYSEDFEALFAQILIWEIVTQEQEIVFDQEAYFQYLVDKEESPFPFQTANYLDYIPRVLRGSDLTPLENDVQIIDMFLIDEDIGITNLHIVLERNGLTQDGTFWVI